MRRIELVGCDDTTYITEKDWGREFTKDEMEVFKKIEKLSCKNSKCLCQPEFYLEEETNNER